MKCNKHSPDDYTSSIGVCASCLRERLLTILVAQQHLQLQQPESIHHHHSIKSETKQQSQSQSQQPIPFQFPQSVSPYISRQNTHHNDNHKINTHRFHFTPQVVVGSTKNKGGGGGWKLTSMLIGLFGGSKKKSKPDSDDWKQTPKRNHHHNNNNNSNLSVFCLSPLVRPGPNRRIVTTMPSFCKNRSRKLADIGRCNYNSNY